MSLANGLTCWLGYGVSMTKQLKREKTTWQGLTVEYRQALKPHNGVYIWCGSVKGKTIPNHGQTVLASVRGWIEAHKRGIVPIVGRLSNGRYNFYSHNGVTVKYKICLAHGGMKRIAIKPASVKGKGRGRGNVIAAWVDLPTNGDTLTAVRQWIINSA